LFHHHHTYIHTTHALSLKGQQGRLKYSSETPTFYQNYLAMRNTADVTGGKPIAVWLQYISGGDAVNPFVAFYDIHGRKKDVQFFCFVSDKNNNYYNCAHWTNLLILMSVRYNVDDTFCAMECGEQIVCKARHLLCSAIFSTSYVLLHIIT
jgi:hypothetical protein